jgi:hypothetical protein
MQTYADTALTYADVCGHSAKASEANIDMCTYIHIRIDKKGPGLAWAIQHVSMPAYVSIRQHMCRPHTSAYASIWACLGHSLACSLSLYIFHVILYIYIYICIPGPFSTSAKAIALKSAQGLPTRSSQYLYFCTSKASKLAKAIALKSAKGLPTRRSQYLYFCTSKASKLSTCRQQSGRHLLAKRGRSGLRSPRA